MTTAYEYGTQPFEHQDKLFRETRDLAGYAVLWEQGCAKTKPMIDTAAYLFEKGEVDAVLVVAPGGVERNWVTDEIPTHLPPRLAARTHSFFYQTKRAGTKWHQGCVDACMQYQGLVFFCISYDAFMSERGKKAVWRFLKRRRCLYVLDESDDIKTSKAKRTKSVVASGAYADYRRILTGTPADKPFDLYSQLRFVDPDIWRRRQMGNFWAFKQHYGEWFTREECKRECGYDPGYDKLLRFKNLDELTEILSGVSSRLLKDDVLDLPDKLYTKVRFDLTPEQRKVYDKLVDEFVYELEDGREVDGELALTRLLRLQQVACGYMVTDDEGDPVERFLKNPRLDATLGWLQRLNHQGIIWCRFRHDVDQLMDALGDTACRYDGQLDDDACERSKNMFNAGEKQWFVGNPAKGARGLTMVAAKTVTYYSNSFKLRDRLQSEDRAHRPGQEGVQHEGHGFGVLYGDLIANDTVDEKIVKALRDKFNIAAQLTGDELRDWI